MKIKWKADINYAAGVIEIDDEDLKGMNEEERTEYINKVVWEEAVQCVDYGWDEIKARGSV